MHFMMAAPDMIHYHAGKLRRGEQCAWQASRFTLGLDEHTIDLGPGIEVLAVQQILNHDRARQGRRSASTAAPTSG
ncbi:hypothetical protein ACF9IK_00030 [Kitasatospora hibisci]|uniref:hypothetical protein n=1 Tax=Kitasatospora hibisci TaxID=3369522 RepID=UPI0037553613